MSAEKNHDRRNIDGEREIGGTPLDTPQAPNTSQPDGDIENIVGTPMSPRESAAKIRAEANAEGEDGSRLKAIGREVARNLGGEYEKRESDMGPEASALDTREPDDS